MLNATIVFTTCLIHPVTLFPVSIPGFTLTPGYIRGSFSIKGCLVLQAGAAGLN